MRVGLVIGAVLALGGCAHGAPPSNAPAVPVFSTAPAAAGVERTVPADCAAVATIDDLTRDLNNLVTGTPTTGCTARIDCYYGVPPKQPLAKAKVWVGLASYVNEESARKRLSATVADERKAGATVSDVKVGPDRGVLIRNANWMLVACRGRVTVVVQVIPVLVRDDHAGMLLGTVADHALTAR